MSRSYKKVKSKVGDGEGTRPPRSKQVDDLDNNNFDPTKLVGWQKQVYMLFIKRNELDEKAVSRLVVKYSKSREEILTYFYFLLDECL